MPDFKKPKYLHNTAFLWSFFSTVSLSFGPRAIFTGVSLLVMLSLDLSLTFSVATFSFILLLVCWCTWQWQQYPKGLYMCHASLYFFTVVVNLPWCGCNSTPEDFSWLLSLPFYAGCQQTWMEWVLSILYSPCIALITFISLLASLTTNCKRHTACRKTNLLWI